MEKYAIEKPVLDAIISFVNFATKYREIPEVMAKEVQAQFANLHTQISTIEEKE